MSLMVTQLTATNRSRRNNVLRRDSNSATDRVRECEKIFWLIDEAFLCVGGQETYAEHRSYGATTLLVRHLKWIGARKVRLRFPGRNNVLWDRIVKLPAYVARAIRDLSAGKRPNERIFSVTSFNVNAYLRNNMGLALTAKDFRTMNATIYLECFMGKLESARLKHSLASGDLKQIFRGISSNRRGQNSQKLVSVARTVTAEVVRQLKPSVEIPTHLRSSKNNGSRTKKAEGRVGALPFIAFLLNSSERLVRTCHFDSKRFLPYCFSWGWDERTSLERQFYTADGVYTNGQRA
jgi:DNA topoisomerase I-like protein